MAGPFADIAGATYTFSRVMGDSSRLEEDLRALTEQLRKQLEAWIEGVDRLLSRLDRWLRPVTSWADRKFGPHRVLALSILNSCAIFIVFCLIGWALLGGSGEAQALGDAKQPRPMLPAPHAARRVRPPSRAAEAAAPGAAVGQREYEVQIRRPRPSSATSDFAAPAPGPEDTVIERSDETGSDGG